MFGRRRVKLLKEWVEFYTKYFDAYFDEDRFSEILLPKPRDDCDEVLLIPQGLTLGEVFDVSTEYFNISTQYENLDNRVIHNERDSHSAYAIQFYGGQEPFNKKIANLSPVKLRENGIDCMTLLERLVYGLKLFIETGIFIDAVNTATVCAGSRDHMSRVPYTHIDKERRVWIKHASPYAQDDSVFARQVFF
jgi:hypothetical protein